MTLELFEHKITKIQLGDQSCLNGTSLLVKPEDIQQMVTPDSCIELVQIACVAPETSVRLAPILDVVEPRAKEDQEDSAFPGWTGPPKAAGQGPARVLKGAAVVAVGRLSGVQQGLIDMSGQAAPYCPFSRTHNLVLVFEPKTLVDRVAADEAIRITLLRAAEFLGGLARGQKVQSSQILEWPPSPCDLPKAALIYLVQSQGELRRTFIYGHAADSMLPTLLDPLEVLDGAVVSGNFVLPGNKTCTYIHQNHPLILEMLRRHAREIDFVGLILGSEMSRLEDKERSAWFVSKLMHLLRARGAIINQEGGQNTLADVMMICRLLEQSDTKTVLLLNESAGADGATPSLTETTPEATAIVSAGNNEYRVTLPSVEKFIGFLDIAGVEGDLTGEITVPLSRVYASTNQLGFNSVSCRSF